MLTQHTVFFFTPSYPRPCSQTRPCHNPPDVVKAVVQRVMHLVADHRPCVVLWGRKNARLLVRVRRVGLGVGWRPQGRGGDRGRRMLLLLDAERGRGGKAWTRGLEGGRRCSGGRGTRGRRGRGGAGHGRCERHLAVALLLAALKPRYFGRVASFGLKTLIRRHTWGKKKQQNVRRKLANHKLWNRIFDNTLCFGHLRR